MSYCTKDFCLKEFLHTGPCVEPEDLYAEIRDLRARLRAAREAISITAGDSPCTKPTCDVCKGRRATDLRLKKWRKP